MHSRNLHRDDGEDWKARPKVRSKRGQLTTVASILDVALRRQGIDRDLTRYRFVLDWDKIVGSELALITKPESLLNGRLSVLVPSAGWAQELGFQKQVILTRLRRYLGNPSEVRDISFRVRP